MPTAPQASFDFGASPRWWEHLWEHVAIEDPRARKLADRHYSRQTPGADGFVPPGERFLLRHQGTNHRGELAYAIWAVCRNRFRGAWTFRNTIFRNETTTKSSMLINRATVITRELMARRYGDITEPLTSEIDILATRKRRSKSSPPGVCYWWAGWEQVATTAKSHGRPAKAIWTPPPIVFYGPPMRWMLLANERR